MENFSGLYFAGYAIMGTLALLVMVPAMLAVNKREGVPIKKKLIGFISAITTAMWVGAGYFTLYPMTTA